MSGWMHFGIDQRDKIEVQQQIQRMTTIYGRARTVFAWLGLDNSHFTELQNTFERLKTGTNLTHGRVLDHIMLAWLGDLGIFEDRQLRKKINQMAFPKIVNALKRFAPHLCEEDQSLHANKLAFVKQLQNVLSYEYWRRAWILQELTVAGDIRLRCGPHDLDFELLSSVINELQTLHASGIFQPFTPYHRHVFQSCCPSHKMATQGGPFISSRHYARAFTHARQNLTIKSILSLVFVLTAIDSSQSSTTTHLWNRSFVT